MPAPISIADQVACVQREVVRRCKTYPQWVLQSRIKKPVADQELSEMQAVLRTLLSLQPLAPLLEMPEHPDDR